jgi:hypothetical protein
MFKDVSIWLRVANVNRETSNVKTSESSSEALAFQFLRTEASIRKLYLLLIINLTDFRYD